MAGSNSTLCIPCQDVPDQHDCSPCTLCLQGIVAIDPNVCIADPMGTLARLWLHESLRVLHDRLVTPEDQAFVKRELHTFLAKRFGCRDSYDAVYDGDPPLLFASFVKIGTPLEDRSYQPVSGALAFVSSDTCIQNVLHKQIASCQCAMVSCMCAGNVPKM